MQGPPLLRSPGAARRDRRSCARRVGRRDRASGLAPASLASLQGAWVADSSRCEDTFFRQGKAIHFVRCGAVKREGILIKSDRVEDSRNRCKIESGKAGPGENAVRLACFSGLQVSNTALSLQRADQDTLVRTSTGFAGDVRRFRRCRL
jgi:hypothetical protein